MDIQTEKIELVKRLLDTDDENILLQVKHIFENQDNSDWDVLPDFVKRDLVISKEQAAEGLVTPHEEVMKKHAKYL